MDKFCNAFNMDRMIILKNNLLLINETAFYILRRFFHLKPNPKNIINPKNKFQTTIFY